MTMTDRRTTTRFRVQFHAAFYHVTTLEGTGVVLDLSASGCRIESPIRVEAGVRLELRIYAPGFGWPLIVEEALVQWASGQIFGLAFFRMGESNRQRLDQVITGLEVVAARADHLQHAPGAQHT